MGTPSARYLASKGVRTKANETTFLRHPNPVKFIEIGRCQAATASGEQCKNVATRWDFCFQHRLAQDAP